MDIVSFGSATVDIFAKSDQFIVKDNLLSVVYSSKNEIDEGLIASGGGATNSSVSFSRLGLKSACVALLGRDPLSEYVLNDLVQNKVDNTLLVCKKNDNTDFSIILVGPDGGRTILTNRGETHLEEDNIDWDRAKKAKWFYITSLEGNIDLLEKIIGFAQENNIKVALNPGRRELKKSKQIIPLFKFVDFLLLNQTEAQEITELEFKTNAFWSKLFSYKSNIIAVTDGREGAYVLTDKKKFFSPAIKVKTIEETGAGDAFGSAFVAALFHNFSVEDALFWGTKNSASVVSCFGAKPGLLTLKQINAT